ncbi:hypothetical protein [Flavivirga rizhaonensis]|uniref:Prepilin-type N-terminal cleavage/methylation domain-containing protein n=1 Tax=Flavivirga rizhaonensis TaxID=2559571 RepID=A0A4S1DST9_9FLAO|nr:hypothetical protein [Flavivirga rizhaonensis]TGV01056.1 hypothetical protein EM932_16995 [Flavivirga rizhaonensis]
MNKRVYLKGFTILEALISLILMGIIITLSYTVFNLVEKQMTLFQNENTSVLQYNLFNIAIKNDIYNAENFIQNDNQLLLEYYNGASINYQVSKNFILRHHDIKTDTFKLNVLSHKFSQSDITKPLNKILHISIEVLGDSINTNYYLKKDTANTINSFYFNETINENLNVL